MGPRGGGILKRKKQRALFQQEALRGFVTTANLKRTWCAGEGGVYIYHPQASHNPLECDVNDGGGGKVPRQRSLTCMQIHRKPEV